VIRWARLMVAKLPELAYLFAIPNQGRAGGRRGRFWGARMAEEGLRAGVPDLMLPAARGGFHGLFIEMKRQAGSTVSAAQKEWHKALKEQGYEVVVARGAQEAIEAIRRYLSFEVSRTASRWPQIVCDPD